MAFADALAGLATVDLEIVATVQAAMIRALLEDLHPAGLTGDDVRSALERTVRSAVAWWPEVRADDLITVYTSALGMSDPDAPARDRAALAGHALLVIADLCATIAPPLPDRSEAATVERYLRTALAEVHRAETVELP